MSDVADAFADLVWEPTLQQRKTRPRGIPPRDWNEVTISPIELWLRRRAWSSAPLRSLYHRWHTRNLLLAPTSVAMLRLTRFFRMFGDCYHPALLALLDAREEQWHTGRAEPKLHAFEEQRKRWPWNNEQTLILLAMQFLDGRDESPDGFQFHVSLWLLQAGIGRDRLKNAMRLSNEAVFASVNSCT